MEIRWSYGGALGTALIVSACAHATVAQPQPAAAPSDAAIVARSDEVLDAYDRGDVGTLRGLLAPGFVKFEDEQLVDRDALIKKAGGKPPHPPLMTRAWKERHVYRRDGDVLFIGMSIEHQTGNASHGNMEYDGWYTISWVRDGDAWKVAHWSWQQHRTSIENERDGWNETFRHSLGFDHRPNRLLVDTVRGVTPGVALDVMMGQGRNAIYLASQGWRVTGVDISDEGLRLARAAAAAQRLELATVQADAETYDYGVAKWDLVTMIYAGNSAQMIEKIKPSLRSGGWFVLEYFLSVPDEGRKGFIEGQLAKLFGDGFDIARDDVVEDAPDWATDRARLVRFVARKR